MHLGLIILVVVVGILVIAGLSLMGTYNKIVSLDEGVGSSWAQVETVLQRRYDLIPNLVNTVKGFASQEKEVLTEVTRLRSQWTGAGSVDDKAKAASSMEGALGRLMVVIEKYPELKSNQNFLALQDELSGTENRLAVERRRYNEVVQIYNTTIRRFPASVVASFGGFEKKEYFQSDAAAAKAPEVKF
jgi:LemA protein